MRYHTYILTNQIKCMSCGAEEDEPCIINGNPTDLMVHPERMLPFTTDSTINIRKE